MASDFSSLSVSEIRHRYAGDPAALTPQVLRKLQRDPRRGVRQLYESLKRRFELERAHRQHLDALLHFERVLWKTGVARVAGVDEVGVGPLAGPLVAAAVVFPPEMEIRGIDDSKRLEPEVREELAREIEARAAGVGLGIAAVEEIDSLNVYQAGLLAMRRAVEQLPEPPEHVLVDARVIPGLGCPQNTFNKGDGINYSIAAASIVAKVTRDHMMEELDRAHPGYGFARHKGYGTAEHQAAIRRHGPSPVHRKSFTFLRELCGDYSALFYELKRRLAEPASDDALRAFEDELEAHRGLLAEHEHRKLRLLVTRRWNLVSRGRTARG